MTRPVLSVVIPIHDEAATLPELVRRTVAAAHRADPAFEVLLVDDGSTDDPGAVPLPEGARMIHLPANRGQLRATLAGLSEAQGRYVVVLDGDLQDPPEPIVDLVRAARGAVGRDAILMVKHRRDAPAWFHLARSGYDLAQSAPGAAPLPAGAGSYLCMRGDLARRVARVRAAEGNLAALVVGLGVRVDTLPYAKAPRLDGDSRVGGIGLFREGLYSLVWTGAATVWLGLIGLLAILAGLRRRDHRPVLGGAAVLGVAAALDGLRRDGLSERDAP